MLLGTCWGEVKDEEKLIFSKRYIKNKVTYCKVVEYIMHVTWNMLGRNES